MVPNKFNGIDTFLPKQRKLIADRYSSVVAAKQAAEQAKMAFVSGQSPIANVLEAAKMRAQSQYDFLKTVNSYNRAITDYVLTVRQDINQPTRLASVLIGRNAVVNRVAKKNPKSKSVIDRPSKLESTNPRILPASSTRQVATKNQSQEIKYAPTAESRKAANYDPKKVVAEAPMSQTKPANTKPYSSNNPVRQQK